MIGRALRMRAIRAGFVAVAAIATAIASSAAYAGAQREEVLADAVRTSLAAQIADRAPDEPVFAQYDDRVAYLRWLGEMGNRLQTRVSDFRVRQELLKSVWYEARRAGLEPSLVLGLIQIESGFRKHAVSKVGARGYMQVMPFWTRQIGDGHPRTLFDLRINLRYGCTILRYYLDRENGDLAMALGRYNGSRGRLEYPSAVLAAQARYDLAPALASSPPGPTSAAR